jgi:RHS repeat-associated protein
VYLDTVDSVFARIDSSGNATWYLPDHLGSVRVVMNSADTTTDVVSYDGFGNITVESNSTFGDRYKWTGRELDTETGLEYNRARYYYAPVGRWISQDPVGFAAGDFNIYRYVDNNPLTFLDPTGQGKLQDHVRTSGPGLGSARLVNFGSGAGNNWPAVGKTGNFASFDVLFEKTSDPKMKPMGSKMAMGVREGYIDLSFDVDNSGGLAGYWFEFHIINRSKFTWFGFNFDLGFGTGAQMKVVPAKVKLEYDFSQGKQVYVPTGTGTGGVKIFNEIVNLPVTIQMSDGSVPPGPVNGMTMFQQIVIPDYDNKMPPNAKTKTGYTFTIRLEPLFPQAPG